MGVVSRPWVSIPRPVTLYYAARGLICKLCTFIHWVVCLTTGPKPLPKRALHIVRSRDSSFKWEHPLLSLRSSSSFLRLLSRLPVSSILPFIFPAITRCRRQFLHRMSPIQLAFCLLISCRGHGAWSIYGVTQKNGNFWKTQQKLKKSKKKNLLTEIEPLQLAF